MTIINVKNIIFDLDGTLVDTLDAHVLSWREACIRFGIRDVTRDELISLFGRTSPDIARGILKARDITDERKVMELANLKDDLFRNKYIVKVRPLPNVHELLTFLKSNGMRIAVVSSNPRLIILRMLEVSSIRRYVDVIVGQDDVNKGKPSPEPILKALSLLNAKPTESIVVGDSVYDIIAARRAGVVGIGIATGVSSPADLIKAGARFVVKDLHELLNLFTTLFSKDEA